LLHNEKEEIEEGDDDNAGRRRLNTKEIYCIVPSSSTQ
jgi:hypothetical protein